MPFEPIRIYFSDLRSSAGFRQAIARVFTIELVDIECVLGDVSGVQILALSRYMNNRSTNLT